MKFKLTNLFNIFFRLLLIFSIIFIWMRYALDSLIISLVITGFITLSIDFTLQFILNKKKYINNIKKDELKKIENLKYNLIFNNQQFVLNHFYNILKDKFVISKQKEYIIIENNNSFTILYPLFNFKKFDCDDFANIIKKIKNKKISKFIICSTAFENEINNFTNDFEFEILLLDMEQTYFSFLKQSPLPNQVVFKQQPVKTYKQLFANSLSRKRTKGYFIASLVMLLSSFIIKYSVYYLIVASILLILSLLSFILPKIKKPVSDKVIL